MFDILRDVMKETAQVFGSITGAVVGIPVAVIAESLDITIEAVNEAKRAGCSTYEEIQDFVKNN